MEKIVGGILICELSDGRIRITFYNSNKTLLGQPVYANSMQDALVLINMIKYSRSMPIEVAS